MFSRTAPVGQSHRCLSRNGSALQITNKRPLHLPNSALSTSAMQLSLSAPLGLSPKLHSRPAPATSTPRTVRARRTLARSPCAIPDIVPLLAESPYRDAICCAACVVGASVFVKFFDLLATEGLLEQKLSRKLVHTTMGPLFLLTWTLYSTNPTARFLAAVVPLLNFTRLLLVGTGVLEDRGLVLSVSRGGSRSELLQGPLYYCAVLICVAVLCWRDSPAGLIAIALMCGGDGLADIVGRRFGTAKLPYNPSKSWAGSMAMFSGGATMALGLIYAFCSLGFFPCYEPSSMLPCVLGIALAATVVESLPINQVLDDNISVPVVSGLLSAVLLSPIKP